MKSLIDTDFGFMGVDTDKIRIEPGDVVDVVYIKGNVIDSFMLLIKIGVQPSFDPLESFDYEPKSGNATIVLREALESPFCPAWVSRTATSSKIYIARQTPICAAGHAMVNAKEQTLCLAIISDSDLNLSTELNSVLRAHEPQVDDPFQFQGSEIRYWYKFHITILDEAD